LLTPVDATLRGRYPLAIAFAILAIISGERLRPSLGEPLAQEVYFALGGLDRHLEALFTLVQVKNRLARSCPAIKRFAQRMAAPRRSGAGLNELLARTDVLFTSLNLIRHLFASRQLLLTRLGTRERTGSDIATWYIGTHHNASGRNLRANEPQREWLGSLAKEALAPPKHHWKSPHVVLVYQ
jgi:hypothetical protein